jgi:DNA-binding transcriptional regulator YiaG
LARALGATNALLERGTLSVKDATVIQVIDMMIRDDALRTVVLKSDFATLARTTADQVRNWEEWRQRQRR